MAFVITSCGPARNSKGEYWNGNQVWHRVWAKNYHPNNKQKAQR